jgi:cell division protein FtsA
MKSVAIGAIDVGTAKVCTLMANVDDSGMPRILGVGISPSHGLQKGIVVDINGAKESIRQSVKDAERAAGYRLESACIGVTGKHISSVNNRGVISITRNDRMVRTEDVRRVLEIARSVKITDDQELLHVIPRAFTVDGQGGLINPVGMYGSRLDVEAHIITAAEMPVHNLTKCIRENGVDIDDLVLEPLATAEAVLTEDEKHNGVLLADIGSGTTDIAVFKENSVCHTSILPVAGYQVTNDVAIGLGVPFELAEEMKKKYGNLAPIAEDRDMADLMLQGDGHSISHNDLSDIIRLRVEEILRLIMLDLPHTDYFKFIPSGLVLTGGTSNLPGIVEIGRKITGFPVRIGTPAMLAGISGSLCDPVYSTSVGLILWMTKRDNRQYWEGQGSFRSRFSQLFGHLR